MTLPLRLELTLPETPLPTQRRLSLRVLRCVASLGGGQGGATLAFALPLAVVDREAEPPRTIGVVDYSLLAGILVAVAPGLALLRRQSGRRHAVGARGR